MKHVSRIACVLAVIGFAATVVTTSASAGVIIDNKPNPSAKSSVIDPNDKGAKSSVIDPSDKGAKSSVIDPNDKGAKSSVIDPNEKKAKSGLIGLKK